MASFQPVVRFAVMSDTHYEEEKPYIRERFRFAMERLYAYADTQDYSRMDALYIVGDFTNRGKRKEMEMLKEDCDGALREETTLVVTMANHDLHYVEDDEEARRDFRDVFGMAYDRHEVFGDYHFISLSTTKYETPWHDSFDGAKRAYLKEELARARRAGGNRPIFVFQHPGNRGTVMGSMMGDTEIYPILSDYPQVIDFSGHSHFAVNDPRETHQRHFTSVSTGSLAYIKYNARRANTHISSEDFEPARYAHMLLVEADAEGVVRIRHFDVTTGEFFSTDRYIRQAHDRTQYVYTKRRAADAVPPTFKEGATLSLVRSDGGVTASFPSVDGTGENVLEYYLRLFDRDGTVIAQKSIYSDFMTTRKREELRITIPCTELPVRAEVFAVGFYDEMSLPLTATLSL